VRDSFSSTTARTVIRGAADYGNEEEHGRDEGMTTLGQELSLISRVPSSERATRSMPSGAALPLRLRGGPPSGSTACSDGSRPGHPVEVAGRVGCHPPSGEVVR